jgi:hypothetical protein
MTSREAMWLALRDFYQHSWRLVAVNAALGGVLVAGVLAALAFPPAAVLLLASGPVAAALVHCAVTLVRTGDLTFVDAWDGLRLNWRRGLVLGAAGAALLVLGVVAIRVYAGSSLWPLAFLALYLLLLAGVYELFLWTLAVARREHPLGEVAREALGVVATRPGATLALGLALLLVNAAGVAAAVMPFLTLTLAYTFLAAARFVLEPEPLEEEAV